MKWLGRFAEVRGIDKVCGDSEARRRGGMEGAPLNQDRREYFSAQVSAPKAGREPGAPGGHSPRSFVRLSRRFRCCPALLSRTAEGGCPYAILVARVRRPGMLAGEGARPTQFQTQVKGGGQECPPHTQERRVAPTISRPTLAKSAQGWGTLSWAVQRNQDRLCVASAFRRTANARVFRLRLSFAGARQAALKMTRLRGSGD
jgi:hypothetical protein